MKCITCPCTDSSLLKLQTVVDNTTLKEISIVLPDFAIPETHGPVFVCTTCQDKIASLYKIKKMSLANGYHWNLYKDILKETSDMKFDELKINDIDEAPKIQIEQDMIFKINQNYNELFSPEDEDQVTEKDCNPMTNNEEPKKRQASKQTSFQCSECNKELSSRNNLKDHTRIHTGERPFTCPTCQKSFTHKSHLNRHKLTHTGERPHECDLCHKMFTQSCHLIRHKRSHTNIRPYQCSECNKAFKRASDLSRHMLIHTGDKPYECPVCPYKCSVSGTLKTHIRIHTGERPYICKFCQKTFTYTSSLKEHLRRIHKNQDLNSNRPEKLG